MLKQIFKEGFHQTHETPLDPPLLKILQVVR